MKKNLVNVLLWGSLLMGVGGCSPAENGYEVQEEGSMQPVSSEVVSNDEVEESRGERAELTVTVREVLNSSLLATEEAVHYEGEESIVATEVAVDESKFFEIVIDDATTFEEIQITAFDFENPVSTEGSFSALAPLDLLQVTGYFEGENFHAVHVSYRRFLTN